MGMRTMSMTTTTLTPTLTPADWLSGMPVLTGTSFTLRELRLEDAPLLLETMTIEEMAIYIRTTPAHGCEPFNIWAHGDREPGNVSFAVVPFGTDTAVGVIQVSFDENPVMH
jgi:RimJ/RimL family protein N-acetyltransferase